MSVTESLFGFDWRTTGPLDVIKQTRERVSRLPTWAIALGALTTAVVGALALYYVSLPVWAWLAVFCVPAGGAIAAFPAKAIIDEMASEDYELLEELHPVDGDRATRKLSQDRWATLTVIDHAGKVRDKSYLTEVSRLVDVNDGGEPEWRTAYEVDCYWPESNVALASWMAGASNADLRRYERAVQLIKEELSIEADRSLDEIVNAPEARRKAASSAVNTIIRTAEGVEAPGDQSITEELKELRKEAEDSVDEILSNRGIEDLDRQMRAADRDGKDPESVAIAIEDARKTDKEDNDE